MIIYIQDKEREILNTRKGKKMTVKVKVYEETKYTAKKTACEVKYEDVTKFEVKQIPIEEILKQTDESGVDEYNEYLIIYFKNGDTATFRNSHVDLFRI